MGTKTKIKEDEFENEFLDPSKVLVEVKVSGDEGETWTRRKISMVSGLDESGLNMGELFQFNGEKFRVMQGEDGLIVEPLKKPVSERKSTKTKVTK
ncbi:hypothetical protein [Desulfosporosinus sp. OT]|uniref:hypothetical protein n=1 Tax=Desulfosporosinus sp. OT TaxID=913865 RepID=UPI0002239BCA|nr:hypothetical protein [Desulfosporosinus sp. OT]EGW37345.1 hypothetical protein DOT_4790 [Desulfosporosinus sp. OT]